MPNRITKREAWDRWHRVSRGEITPEVAAWLADVARSLLEAVAEPDTNRRRQAFINATGLGGKAGSGKRLHEAMALRTLADAGLKGQTLQQAAAIVVGLPAGRISTEALRKRIARAKKSKS